MDSLLARPQKGQAGTRCPRPRVVTVAGTEEQCRGVFPWPKSPAPGAVLPVGLREDMGLLTHGLD